MEELEGKEATEQQDELVLTEKNEHESGRPGRRTSKVWTVFNRLSDNNAQCNICSRILSFKSSVTNLAKHIQRKHPSSYASMVDEDPREGLREFITIDTGRGKTASDDDGEGDPIRADDTEWLPATKSAKKVTPPTKKVKKEIITSNGVDYVIYTHDQPAPASTPSRPAFTTRKATVAHRSSAAYTPLVTSSPIKVAPPSQAVQPVEEDEFATFAKFLSQRIRALKNPYWQSCAINEINSALHRIEMRRYEMPKPVDSAQSFVQTEPMEPIIVNASTIVDPSHHDPQQVVEVITQDMA